MRKLLKEHRLNLLQAQHKKIIEDTFDDGLGNWRVIEGDWHQVTVDTNEDKKTGIEGELLIDAAGSWEGGIMEREIELDTYGEIIFERYVKNDDPKTGENKLNFYIDGELKASMKGPIPWRRVEPIGVSPGKHVVRFEYKVGKDKTHKSGIIDTFTVWESRAVDATIAKYTPPKPVLNVAQQRTLRGHTRFQEMTATDTEINFSVLFNGLSYLDFATHHDKIFYFIDEFGVCYRGIFVGNFDPKSVALNHVYYVNLTMIAPQKVGVGFV